MFGKGELSDPLWHGAEPGAAARTDGSTAPEKAHGDFMRLFYQKYWDSLCAWLRSRYGNGPPEPEDMAQSAFEKLSLVAGLEKMSNPRAYLFTVAARNVLDELRGVAVRRKYIHQVMVHYGDDVEDITPERILNAREEMVALTADMKALSPVQREVVMRSRLMGQTYSDISRDTGWSTSAISRHLQNAMILFAEQAAAREEDRETGIERKSNKGNGVNS